MSSDASQHDLAHLASSTSTSSHPTAASIVQTLQQRLRSDQPYTRLSSSTLVVVNPLRPLANLNDASAQDYQARTYGGATWEKERQPSPEEVLPPHPYELACRAYHMMRRTGEPQSILSLGSSDAGKSFASKLVTEELLRLASSHSRQELKQAQQLKAFDILLTSFGCAKTRQNSNASRFHRYLELHFTHQGRLAGATALTYGLEKARLVQPIAREERSFHVFYQLLAGATQQEREDFKLQDVTEYALLSSSGCYRLPAGGEVSDDRIAFEALRDAMKTLGFKGKHVHAIFTLLSAVLLLGNIDFTDRSGEEGCEVANHEMLDDVASLLGVEAHELGATLTNRSRWVRKELVSQVLTREAAQKQRDGLVRDLYAILFAFVVETANHRFSPASPAEAPQRIALLDMPGFQQQQGQTATFSDFSINVANECLLNWVQRAHVAQQNEMVADGVEMPEDLIVEQQEDNTTACVELLRGSVVGTQATDRKPAGLLGSLSKLGQAVRSGEAREEDENATQREFDSFAPYAAYVKGTSPHSFGVKHYNSPAPTTYSLSSFLAQDMDVLDSAFVQLLRRSHTSFVARLFAGPSLATESHPHDPNTIVNAQVSARPLRVPAGSEQPLLDPSKHYGVTRQMNATLSSILGVVGHTQQWRMFCIRPNDISQPGSFDTRSVTAQVESLRLPALIARARAQEQWVRSVPYDEFCQRYNEWIAGPSAAAGASAPREKAQAFVIANAWREGADFAFGQGKVWLAYGVWRRMEDRLRSTEGGEDLAAQSAASMSLDALSPPPLGRDQSMASLLSPMGGHGALAGGASSEDDLLLRPRPSDVTNPFNTPGADKSSIFNDAGGMLAGAGAGVGAGAGWNEWEKHNNANAARAYGDIDPVLAEKASLPRGIDAVEEVETSAIRRWWVRFVWLFTWWIPSSLLSSCGGMKRPDVQMAWREKVTICALIFLSCALVLFYILAFGRILCPNQNKAWNAQQLSTHAGEDDYYVAVAGKVYDLTKFYKSQHSDISNLQVDQTTMLQLAGQDLTPYFPVPLTLGCPTLVTDESFTLTLNSNLTATITQAVHTSGSQQADQSSKLANNRWYTQRFLPKMKGYYKGDYVYSKKQVSNDSSWRTWAIVDEKVYDLTNYLNTVSTSTQDSSGGQAVAFLDSSITDLFKSQPGTDITNDYHKAMNSLSATAKAANQNCLDNVFYAGKTDFRDTAKCQVQNYLLLSFSCLIVATILAKFIAALQLTSKRNPEQQDKFVICQVPCYTEGEDELRKTIDSIAGQKYDDKRKLLFITCDGMIVGSGNETPTPRIVLDILGVDPKVDPEPLMFKSIAEGSKQLNYAKVYSGLYEFEGHVVPYVVVVKCGRPSERTKPGNRGKRDTQILLMRYLNRVHFDSPMYPMELEIYHQMKNVIGIDPAFYEFVLMVDADTSVEPDGLNRLVAVAADDSRIIALCGETTLDNEEGSWWTMIQVYEYYISHHLAKAFESLFGSVTCLPGCFSMYRIRSADKGRPLFISNRIIDDYSENRVDTLHKKNLLQLGEDRYLTTLILKHFPAFRTKFTPDAKAHTAAPDQFGVLLSQRRRWINSTVHNLAELVLMPELCGFCLFSMRFVVFVDLLGTIILPATVVYLIYLIVTVATGQGQFPLISIILIAAVYGLQAIIFLVKRQWQYIGWLIIYILAYPIYSFFLPVYSFWHMDDFSWGNTRVVVGEKGNKKIIAGTDDEPYDDSMIPLVRFSEYQRDVWEHGGTVRGEGDGMSVYSGAPGVGGPLGGGFDSPFGGGPSHPPSMYKVPSYAGSAVGGDNASTYDYFQTTNVLGRNGSPAHSRASSYGFAGQGGGGSPSRPGSRAASTMFNPGNNSGGGGGGMPRAPSMSMLSGNALQHNPNANAMMTPSFSTGSMWGMPSYSSTSMPMGTPHPTTMSMYGGFPSLPSMGTPGMGMDNRSSMMLFGASPMMPAGGMMANPFAPSNPASPSAAAGGSAALGRNEEPNPSEEELRTAIITFLGAQADLYHVTKRQVRTAVEDCFVNADLKSKKATLDRLIDAVLKGE
ncbi:hypothetical protein BDZ90DRAFT_122125 [Jaminaea rosea]|uniref:chitin synthase n=1 Tax=Jaminaea rosea TaxID=1569628 RepID=A0A316UK69_9BASI|nr:hypothetical protein BDZ90DRAFT_122125 [Jaminaea rosea]PWN24363.1 hypothetical protein BDZ90DRAFT_122125 [Jaminaea rosea]